MRLIDRIPDKNLQIYIENLLYRVICQPSLKCYVLRNILFQVDLGFIPFVFIVESGCTDGLLPVCSSWRVTVHKQQGLKSFFQVSEVSLEATKWNFLRFHACNTATENKSQELLKSNI